MPTESGNLAVSCVSADPARVRCDLLCVPIFEDDDAPSRLDRLDQAVGGAIASGRASGEITGKPNELFFTNLVDAAWATPRLLLIGAGNSRQFDRRRAEIVGGVAGMAARERRLRRLALLAGPGLDDPTRVQALVEGVLLGAFRDTRFKSDPEPSPRLAEIQVLLPDGTTKGGVETAVERATVLAASTNLARELSNEPANLFTPRVFADRAVEVVSAPHTSVEILEETAIASHQMGLLQGVAQGSAEPARVIVMRYTPDAAPAGPVLALVGKGVTFDTGGISIKPADGMDRMKRDMAGGAAVVGAMQAIERLAPPIRVIGIVPAAENMPGGRAIRPGDVLTAANGTRVEVLNTDAEGRLILADALTLAQRLGATHLVDIATLTGSCVVALGHHVSGLVGSPSSWVETVMSTAEAAGERVWALPGYDEYGAQLKSDTADLANVGGRPGGAITAALFLKRFTGGLPWAHLDIAGTAWWEEAKPWHPAGATGVGVRTLAALAGTLADQQQA